MKSIWRFKKALTIVFLFKVLFMIGCSGESKSDPVNNGVGSFMSDSGNFSFVLNNGLTQSILAPIESKLEANYSRVLNDLGIASMSLITIKIYNDETDFLNEMQNDLGVKYPGASGYISKLTEIKMMFRPNSPQIALHEFCHVVSLAVNNRFGNNPRWFWETVAIYEAGEFNNPTSISYLVNGNYPTLEELNSSFNSGYKIYEVGFILSEYIIHDFGKVALVNLIKSNADIESTLGITVLQFENAWKNFVRNKYFISDK